tara:strand:- start:3832 stop:5187 length:1356 start_codon:yes stop_codon:yes gene_type:complete
MKHYIENSNINYQDSIFISYKNQQVTFGEFYHHVCEKSRSLSRLNLTDNQIIGILLTNPIDIIEVYFSCIQMGAIPLIVPIDINTNELNNIISTHKISLIITEWLQKKKIKNIDKSSFFHIQELSSSFGGCSPIDFESTINNLDAIQSLHLTSGSTGAPKLISLSFNNFIHSVSQWENELKLKNDDKYIQCLPLNHIGGLSIIIRSQILGFETLLVNKFSVSKINSLIDTGATLISLVPSMLQRLINGRQGLPFPKTLRGIILGGDNCSNKLMMYALDNSLPIYKTYGMTETCSGVAGFWLKKYPDMLNSVGKRFKGNKIFISNDRINITGPTVSPKFKSNNDEYNTIHTADTGYIEKNFLYLTGRCDDIVITGGENISLSKIKNLLFNHDSVIDLYIKTYQDEEIGTIIEVYIESSDVNLSANDFKRYLSRYLSSYQMPSDIIIVDKIYH